MTVSISLSLSMFIYVYDCICIYVKCMKPDPRFSQAWTLVSALLSGRLKS